MESSLFLIAQGQAQKRPLSSIDAKNLKFTTCMVFSLVAAAALSRVDSHLLVSKPFNNCLGFASITLN